MATSAELLVAAQARLAELLQAQTDAAAGQEVRLTSAGGIDRAVIMADPRSLRSAIRDAQLEVNRLQAAVAGRPTLGGITYSQANFGNN